MKLKRGKKNIVKRKALNLKLKNGDKNEQLKKNNETLVSGKHNLIDENEELVYDPSAYIIYERFQTTYPCLSFDPIRDNGTDGREDYPASCIIVCGTQADKPRNNSIITIRLANIDKLKCVKEDDDEESSSDEGDDDPENEEGKCTKPIFCAATLSKFNGVNRIRQTRLSPTAVVCACWDDGRKVQLWNLSSSIKAISEATEDVTEIVEGEKPLHTFDASAEGFALDWSTQSIGTLASGNNNGHIHTWTMRDGGVWIVSPKPYRASGSSVEDIQWSPTEASAFASVGVDKTVRLWDIRVPQTQANIATLDGAHESDINVLSWNALESYWLLTGGDDSMIKVWDFRRIPRGDNRPAAVFQHHTGPLTSVQWAHGDSTTFAASGEDHQTTIWDISVEKDDEEMEGEGSSTMANLPDQLLFQHYGQRDVKEVRWHPSLKGVLMSTSAEGFDIIRPAIE